MKHFTIIEQLLEAYLKCEYKFYLKAMDKAATDTKFSDFQRKISEDFRREGLRGLLSHCDANKCFRGTPAIAALKTKRYPLVVDFILDTEGMRSHIYAVERITCRGSRKPSMYVPVRFVPAERISKLDKLLVSFDAIALSKYLGQEPLFAKIIHGRRFGHLKVRLPELMHVIKQYLEKMTLQHSASNPPEIVLNKHCEQCESFRISSRMSLFCHRCAHIKAHFFS